MKKGFKPDGWNADLSARILDALDELDPSPLSVKDLCFWLRGVQSNWLIRPLARLVETKAIISWPELGNDRDGKVVERIVYSLAPMQTSPKPTGPEPIPVEKTVVTTSEVGTVNDDDCAACEQIGVGRGSCSSCASRTRPSPRRRARS